VAGIEPDDERLLARASGLAVGERGGVVVDENCQTADEHVYAIGECACIDGRVYGLAGVSGCARECESSGRRRRVLLRRRDRQAVRADLLDEIARYGEESGRLRVVVVVVRER
jgi:hypothetical protein